MIPVEWMEQAKRRLDGLIHQTPLTYDTDHNLYLKWENRQITGSFKIRGALNKVLCLERWEQQRGLVTASAGNHGQGVAYAARKVDAPVIVFASEHAAPGKVEKMRALGADVRLVPGGYADAERAGLRYADEHDLTWVSPYNDGQVIAGQATVGLEILSQMAPVMPMAGIVPVGGGGLIGGIGAAVGNSASLQGMDARPLVIGVNSEASPFFHAIYYTGSQTGVEEQPSLADGLSGAVEEGSITIPLVRSFADRFVLVSEDQVAQAVAFAYRRYGEVIEGSAAVALAAALDRDRLNLAPTESPIAVVISGGNIQPEVHEQICARWGAAEQGAA